MVDKTTITLKSQIPTENILNILEKCGVNCKESQIGLPTWMREQLCRYQHRMFQRVVCAFAAGDSCLIQGVVIASSVFISARATSVHGFSRDDCR